MTDTSDPTYGVLTATTRGLRPQTPSSCSSLALARPIREDQS
jgi:hypothetical protein